MASRGWSIVYKAYWIFAALGGIYAVILGLLLHPTIQKHALYAHKAHTGNWWHNVSEPETFGFAKNQVTPFHLPTADGELLYCWHILPLRVYAEHQEAISRAPSGPVDDFTETLAYDLLRKDPKSRVVVNFHGNAGHIAQGYRPLTYASVTSLPHTHVLTCDYRGFGFSTGFPSEAGLITDGVTLASYVLNELGQPAERTVLLGQSLGTAVASATTLFFLDPGNALIPESVVLARKADMLDQPTTFAATVLVAPFTSIPSLLMTYRILGIVPVLSPLKGYPKILKFLVERIVDTWPSLLRWQAAFSTALSLKVPLNLQILHARNDGEIPFHHGESLFEGVAAAMKEAGVEQSEVHERRSNLGDGVRRGAWAYRKCEDEWVEGPRSRNVELEITRWGGHNRIVSNSPVALAAQRAFEQAEKKGQS